MALGEVAARAGDERRGARRAARRSRQREQLDARGDQLDRERQPVEPLDDLARDRGIPVDGAVGADGERPLHEQVERLVDGERRQRVLALAADAQRLAARREHAQAGRRLQQPRDVAAPRRAPARSCRAPAARAAPRAAGRSSARAARRAAPRRRARGRSPASTRPGSRTAASGTKKTPFANAAATRSPAATARRVLPVPPGPVTVRSRVSPLPSSSATSPSSRPRPMSGVAGVGRLVLLRLRSGGNSPSPAWKSHSGSGRSLSRCSPRSAKVVTPSAASRAGARHDDLAAVGARRDARHAVHVEPDVVAVGDRRLAGVDAHAHAERQRGQRLLSLPRGGDRFAGRAEGDEERVALAAEDDAPVPLDRLAQQPAVLGEQLGVLVAALAEQRGRALDVGEQERDRPFRQRRHRRHDARRSGRFGVQERVMRPCVPSVR